MGRRPISIQANICANIQVVEVSFEAPKPPSISQIDVDPRSPAMTPAATQPSITLMIS